VDAKAVDEVHHLRAGIKLPVFLALGRGQQPFKDAADDVVIQEGKVEAWIWPMSVCQWGTALSE
jgi:hypothetical protein